MTALVVVLVVLGVLLLLSLAVVLLQLPELRRYFKIRAM